MYVILLLVMVVKRGNGYCIVGRASASGVTIKEAEPHGGRIVAHGVIEGGGEADAVQKLEE